MDAFKRCYSNNDCDVSIPYFWENFDKENYTIWRGSYKYNDELEKIFMSCNLVSGKCSNNRSRKNQQVSTDRENRELCNLEEYMEKNVKLSGDANFAIIESFCVIFLINLGMCASSYYTLGANVFLHLLISNARKM